MGKTKHHHKSQSASTTQGEGKGKAYKEFSDNVHTLIHSLRLIPNYKASNAEIKVSRWILELYAPTCKECKEVQEKNKTAPAQAKSLLSKFGEALDNA